tara:strand:- start:43 stop:474 length:432 start_codon:yes stop_codon:yes gene_type:complete
MTTAIRYALPAISHAWLTTEVLAAYPAHDEPGEPTALVETLVLEYLKLWHLVIHYPERRVVAPGPIAAIQRVHWKHRKRYFDDCMEYFNRYLFKEMVWGGRLDISGTLDTVRTYRDLYQNDLPPPWGDIAHEYELGRSHLHVI